MGDARSSDELGRHLIEVTVGPLEHVDVRVREYDPAWPEPTVQHYAEDRKAAIEAIIAQALAAREPGEAVPSKDGSGRHEGSGPA